MYIIWGQANTSTYPTSKFLSTFHVSMNLSNETPNSDDVTEENPEDTAVQPESDSDEKTPGGAGTGSNDKNLASSIAEPVEEDESKYPSGQKRALLFLSLALVVFIIGMVRFCIGLMASLILIRLFLNDGTIVSASGSYHLKSFQQSQGRGLVWFCIVSPLII